MFDIRAPWILIKWNASDTGTGLLMCDSWSPPGYGRFDIHFLMISLYVRLDWMEKPLSMVST